MRTDRPVKAAVQAVRALAERLASQPGCRVKLSVGRPASAATIARYEGVLHPEVLAFARAANGLRFAWWEGEQLRGQLHVRTLAQFAKSTSTHGLEPMDCVIQRFNLSDASEFVVLIGNGDYLYVFDGDYCQPATVGSLAEVIQHGCKAMFCGEWEASLNATRGDDVSSEE
jgi:hypothetical protein